MDTLAKLIKFLNKLSELSNTLIKGSGLESRSVRSVGQQTQSFSQAIIGAPPEPKLIVIKPQLPEKCPYCGARIDSKGIRGAIYICPYCKHTTYIDIFVDKL